MYDTESPVGKQVIQLRKIYETLRLGLGRYELYNLLEKSVIDIKLSLEDQAIFKSLNLENLLVKSIKGLAMQLSRHSPADWNKFLDVVIK